MPADTTHIDSTLAAADSAALALSDSLAAAEDTLGILLVHDPQTEGFASEPNPGNVAQSPWLMGAMLLLMLLLAAKLRKNLPYFRHLFTELGNVRQRSNMFNSTVRENTFTIILNTIEALSAGILIASYLRGAGLAAPGILPTLICIGACVAYTLLMPLAYGITGRIFSTPSKCSLWLKGFFAAQSILGVLLLIPALLSIFHPDWWEPIIITSLVIFGAVKIAFIIKGLRIFVTDFNTILVFSYYLCSLEIVPLIATCVLSFHLCGVLA